MEFDFTNTSEAGYTILPPDRYPIITGEWWFYKKEETGNLVLSVDTKVTDGKYTDEGSRYFQTIKDTEKSRGHVLRLMRTLGIIVEGDRGKNGALKAEFVYGEKNDDGHIRIKAVAVNGEERAVEGLSAIAVVVKREDDPSKTKIDQFEPVEAGTVAGKPAAPAASAPQASGAKSKLPF